MIVDKPGAPQTQLLIGKLGLMRSAPDFEVLDVANQILGGLFSSRLNLNLRERHGFTYGAFSVVTQRRGVGPIYAGASVKTEFTGRSVAESLKEIEAMGNAEVTPAELELAKESISRSLPSLFETTETTVATIGTLFLFDLPPDYYEGLPARLSAVSAADVLEVSRRHFQAQQMMVVAVGDRAQIEPQLAALGLGPITVRRSEGGASVEALRR